MSLPAAAESAGVDVDELRQTLNTLAGRGGCAQRLGAAAADGSAAAAMMGLCPPPASRAALHDRRVAHIMLWVSPNAAATRSELVSAAVGDNYQIRADAYRHPQCPPLMLAAATVTPERLRALAAGVKLAATAAAHRACVPAALIAAATGYNIAAANAAIANPACPQTAVRHAAESFDPLRRETVARNPHLPAMLADRLRRDPDTTVRVAAVARPDTNSDTLTALACDPITKHAVRCAAVSHPNLAAETLHRIAGTVDLASAVAASVMCDPSLLKQFAQHHDISVRVSVAANPTTPPTVLERLTADEPAVGCAIATNSACNPTAAAALTRSRSWAVHRAAALSPAVPLKDLLRLTTGPDTRTAAIALHALKHATRTPRHTISDPDTTRAQPPPPPSATPQ